MKFQRIPVTIAGAYATSIEPMFIEEKMQKLIAEHNAMADVPLIVKTALFHLEFEGIHPFVDGNGRTGRLIANLELIQKGYPPINIKFTDRKRYYEAFDSYYRDSDANAMVALFAEALEERLDLYLQCAE